MRSPSSTTATAWDPIAGGGASRSGSGSGSRSGSGSGTRASSGSRASSSSGSRASSGSGSGSGSSGGEATAVWSASNSPGRPSVPGRARAVRRSTRRRRHRAPWPARCSRRTARAASRGCPTPRPSPDRSRRPDRRRRPRTRCPRSRPRRSPALGSDSGSSTGSGVAGSSSRELAGPVVRPHVHVEVVDVELLDVHVVGRLRHVVAEPDQLVDHPQDLVRRHGPLVDVLVGVDLELAVALEAGRRHRARDQHHRHVTRRPLLRLVAQRVADLVRQLDRDEDERRVELVDLSPAGCDGSGGVSTANPWGPSRFSRSCWKFRIAVDEQQTASAHPLSVSRNSCGGLLGRPGYCAAATGRAAHRASGGRRRSRPPARPALPAPCPS